MDRSAASGGFQFLVILLTEFFAVTLAMAIQALTPNFFVASLLNPFILVLFTIMSGVMVPKPNMQAFWKSWMYQLDPFTRIIAPMSATALHNIPVVCAPDELNSFAIPTGTTCGEYAADFMSQAPGYLVNTTATGLCNYCAFSKGDDFLEELGISFNDRGRDVGILGMFCVTNLIIVFVAVSRLTLILSNG
jgi:ATP-binding cassette subfamily G (WHITE) protein 2 (SNQ2)